MEIRRKRLHTVWIISACLLFSSCSEQSSPVGPTPNDAALRAGIVGTWTHKGATAIYNPDGTFIQMTFEPYYTRAVVGYATMILKGNYAIDHGELIKTNVAAVYMDPEYSSHSFEMLMPPVGVQVSGDILVYNNRNVLTRTGPSTDSLWGTWNSTEWEVAFDSGSVTYSGRLEKTYTFHRDLSYYHLVWRYVGGTLPPGFTATDSIDVSFSYKAPLLQSSGTDFIVEFRDSVMYWQSLVPSSVYRRKE